MSNGDFEKIIYKCYCSTRGKVHLSCRNYTIVSCTDDAVNLWGPEWHDRIVLGCITVNAINTYHH